MSEPKHTPGPRWVEGFYSVTAHNPKVPWGEVGDPEPNYVPVCVTTNFTNSHDVGVGNANLIAAAPEMLEILENMVIDGNRGLGPEIYDKYSSEIDDAIAKAKGEDKTNHAPPN